MSSARRAPRGCFGAIRQGREKGAVSSAVAFPHSYLTLFNQRSNMSFRFVSSPSSPSDVGVPPPEEKYTGHILVSEYHVSFLPRKFPQISKLGSRLDNGGGDFTPLPTKLRVSTSVSFSWLVSA
ncbi:hypothetical protein BGW80DRAFT_1301510 [Lactifluus volemus]|nr:hypothetical protein BGW80DRAFT_1301510 [Lactifluus volemus]